MSHVETMPNWTTVYAAASILSWGSLIANGAEVSREGTGSVGFIPFYRTREEVIKLFGDVKILEFKRVEEETERKEDSSQKGCCKREACKKTRTNSCGSKGCKANRSATKGDRGC